MLEYRGLDSVREPPARRPIVTLGVFDGLHLGHRAILSEVVRLARSRGGPSWVLTFEDHPDRVLRGTPPPRITSISQQLRLLEALGLDACWILPFNAEIRSIPGAAFVARFLVDRLRIAGAVLGEGARFGFGARGDVTLLREMGRGHGFETRSIPVVLLDGLPVSSTRVREALLRGELDLARRMLGRPFAVEGTVVRGDGRGRGLGIPTANLSGEPRLLPPVGVYATSARVGGAGREHPAVTNVGHRPTFHQDGELRGGAVVETHLLDFQGDLLGRTLEVRFLKGLRGERTFRSGRELVSQIRRDIEAARRVAACPPGGVEKGLTGRSGGL